MSIEPFLKDLQDWAAGDDNVLAVGLCGSHARAAARPGSDIDLVIICRAPSLLLADLTWASRFADIASARMEDYGLVRSARVFYRDGREVEFGITGAAWCDLPLDSGTAGVIADGFRPLYDPVGRLREAMTWVEQHRTDPA